MGDLNEPRTMTQQKRISISPVAEEKIRCRRYCRRRKGRFLSAIHGGRDRQLREITFPVDQQTGARELQKAEAVQLLKK
jgi:hypothetical protein